MLLLKNSDRARTTSGKCDSFLTFKILTFYLFALSGCAVAHAKDSDWYSLKQVNGVLLVATTTGPKNAYYLLDTGSDVCALDTAYMETQSWFDELDGHYLPKPDGPYQAFDFGYDPDVDLSAIGKAYSVKVVGIIGKRYFTRHIIQIDYAKSRFREVTKETIESGSAGERFKMTIDHDHFFFGIDVAGKMLDKVLIDTGSNSFLTLDEKTAAVLGVTSAKSHPIKGTSVYGVVEALGYRPDSLDVHGTKFDHPKIAVLPAKQDSDPAAVGNEFLSHYVVTIDADGGAMYLKPVDGPTTAATTQPAGREMNRGRK